MPIYEYQCLNSKCPREGERFEERLPIADRETACVRCPTCNSQARFCPVPSVPAVGHIMEPGEVYGGSRSVKATTRGQRR